MSSKAILDFETLLAPIAGANPAGGPLPFLVRKKLEDSRIEIDPSAFADNDPRKPEKFQPADWEGITQLAQETLARTSKDMMVAARLTEALVKLHGFTGLRDGLRLLRRLTQECWERVHPLIPPPPTASDGDPDAEEAARVEYAEALDARAAAFNWLDDENRAGLFPNTVRMVPLTKVNDQRGYGWRHWKESQKPPGPDGQPGRGTVTAEAFDQAVAATPREYCQTVGDDLAECSTDLAELTKILGEKMGEQAPGLSQVRRALLECQELAQQILKRKGPAPVAAKAVPSDPADSAAPEQVDAAPPAPKPLTRDDVLSRLADASALLLEMEPHSPIAYLVQRAVKLARLPLPDLMRVLVRDPAVLGQLDRDLDLGLERQDAAKQQGNAAQRR